MQKLPISTNLNEIDAYMLQGQAIFNFHTQIKKILQQQLNKRNINIFFTVPAVNNTHGKIVWFTSAIGETRTMQELKPEERRWVSQQLKAFSKIINNTIRELQATSGDKSFGALALSHIFITPNIQNSLFLVGSNLVIAEWGCVPIGADPRDHDLLLLDAPYNNLQTDSPSPNEADISPQVKLPQVRLWRCFVFFAVILSLLTGLSTKGYSYISAQTHVNLNSEAKLNKDIQNMNLQIQTKLDSCQKLKDKPAAQKLIEPTAIEAKPLIQEFIKSISNGTKPLDNKALDRKDISVFEGDWRMITELYEADINGKPQFDKKVEYELSFHNDGLGLFSIKYNDGDICKAPISVQIESKDSFVIKTPSLQCQKRKPRDISIEKSGNITCDLTEPDHASCLIQCYKGSCGTSFEK
jgi:hypothetical protein